MLHKCGGRCVQSSHVWTHAVQYCVGRSCFSAAVWALSPCKVSVGYSGLCAGAHSAAPTSLILADVVANIAAAAAAAAVTAAERGRETKGHGSKAEAPHLYRR